MLSSLLASLLTSLLSSLLTSLFSILSVHDSLLSTTYTHPYMYTFKSNVKSDFLPMAAYLLTLLSNTKIVFFVEINNNDNVYDEKVMANILIWNSTYNYQLLCDTPLSICLWTRVHDC